VFIPHRYLRIVSVAALINFDFLCSYRSFWAEWRYWAKPLKGEKAADLPVQAPTKFELPQVGMHSGSVACIPQRLAGYIHMITLEDCIGLCGLTEEEVLAVAEHEHLPEIAATALAQYLLSREYGSEDIRDMIVEDIRQAQWSGNKEHVLTLLHVLHHFLLTHPEARPSEHPWSHRF
jgi:hypothetical protein